MQKQRAKMLVEKMEGRRDHSLVLPILRLSTLIISSLSMPILLRLMTFIGIFLLRGSFLFSFTTRQHGT
jgi:hypothetical protein